MREIKDGGQAFPNPHYEDEELQGMSLRDYFAAKELAKVSGPMINDEPEMYDRLAGHCYRMADAMLRARGGE